LAEGLFFVLEGIDGCGKSTQAGMLEEKLKKENIPAVLTREPGGTAVGENIRDLLLDPGGTMGTCTEMLLYAAARAQLVQEVIQPALNQGKTVVCDRFVWSSLAYQGAGRGAADKKIYQLNQEVTKGLTPDLTFILDVDVEEARRRLEQKNATKGGDRLENMDMPFYRRVREKYLTFAQYNPVSVEVISSHEKPEAVHCQIWSKVREILPGRE